MALTLDRLLVEARSDQIKCVAGFKGLSRPVLDTTIIDTPEILVWLKGGELVMSTGYVFSNNRQMVRTIVKDLASKGCAGLAFKSKRYFDEIPQVILDQGNELDFPILELSYDMRMSDLANFVYSNIYRRELTTQEQVYRLYNTITTALASEKDISFALFEIAKHVQNPVFLLNSDMALQAYELPENSACGIAEYLQLELGEPPLPGKVLEDVKSLYHSSKFRGHTISLGAPEQALDFILFSLEMSGENLGFFAILEANTGINIDHFRLIEGIIPVLCVHVLKNNFLRVPSIGDRNGFVKNVLLDPQVTVDTVKQYSNAFGFQYKLKRVCTVVQIAGFLSLAYNRRNVILSSIAGQIDQTLLKQERSFYYTQYEDKFIYFFFFPLSTEDRRALDIVLEASQGIEAILRDTLNEEEVQFQLGVSDCSLAWDNIPRTYMRALNAIELGKKINPGRKLHSYTGNLVYHILYECLSHGQLMTLYTNTLAALDAYDTANDTDLMRTLAVYCEQNYNRSKTAEALYVHRNTLFYRLDKIEEILHVDLNNAETLHNLFLGLNAKKLLDDTM